MRPEAKSFHYMSDEFPQEELKLMRLQFIALIAASGCKCDLCMPWGANVVSLVPM